MASHATDSSWTNLEYLTWIYGETWLIEESINEIIYANVLLCCKSIAPPHLDLNITDDALMYHYEVVIQFQVHLRTESWEDILIFKKIKV